ncbi:uncharacterized protein FOMMEDRAFT_25875 [Fomitiporia mediterranea MF3/22]|uniref:uncharacterized protein n=1 Tax=Fomitiporia mediterranea (strain MF3/22) TaxID=694068 RepID=UPI0004408228|nr:uncharacterized protein FOMMEDRAFT_25875 [Fomitiporia mediterranea MF3/22]EJD06649.1 hypothetical protein FOMMEDRAFT_25875 [Fomitiporia mediterranea MF3/22]
MEIIKNSSTSFGVPQDVFDKLSSKSQTAIARLLVHKPESFDLTKYPTTKLAAVLVLLYEKPEDKELYVLLTTRSKKLRSHPGQTALPGGKCEDSDADVIETAYREAAEEVALPLHSSSIHALCILRPWLSKYRLLVTPVVTLLSDLSVLDTLVPSDGEVEAIFEHPLEAVLDPELVLARNLWLAETGGEHWPYEEELYNHSDTQYSPDAAYRMHRFRTSASPIKGLTSDILIMTAELAYARSPTYPRWAPGQATSFAGIAQILEREREAHEAAILHKKTLGTGILNGLGDGNGGEENISQFLGPRNYQMNIGG